MSKKAAEHHRNAAEHHTPLPTITAKRPSITIADTTRKPHIMPTRLEAMRFTRENTPRKPARPIWRSTARNSVPFCAYALLTPVLS